MVVIRPRRPLDTPSHRRTPPLALSPAQYIHAIGVDDVGLPMYKPKPMRVNDQHVVYLKSDPSEPTWLCRICRRRRTEMYFFPDDRCTIGAARCIDCKKKSQRKRFTPRYKAIGNDMIMRYFCRPEGIYKKRDEFREAHIRARAALCRSCHKHEKGFVRRHRKKVPYERDRRCIKCGLESSRRICLACKRGYPSMAVSPLVAINVGNLVIEWERSHAKATQSSAKTTLTSHKSLQRASSGWQFDDME